MSYTSVGELAELARHSVQALNNERVPHKEQTHSVHQENVFLL
jgi:hypothetical protein